jgi:hypothetical protein
MLDDAEEKTMRILLIGFLMATAWLASTTAANESKDVVVRTDKFTGETSVVLKTFSVASGVDADSKLVQLAIGAGYFSKSGQIMLTVQCYASTYKFLDGMDVLALADGERIDLGHFKPGRASLLTSGVVMTNEVIAGYVDRVTLAKLAGAKTLELKVGTWEIKLKDKHVQKLREFAAAVPATVQAK